MRGSAPILIAILLAAPPGAAFAQPLAGSIPIIQHPRFDPQTEYEAGVAALDARQDQDAEAHFEHVLAVSPDHPQALYHLGVAEARLGDLKGAARDYAAAVRGDPELIDALRQLALVETKLGRDDQARAQLGRLKRLAQTCGGACAEADDITAGIAEVEAALAKPPAG